MMIIVSGMVRKGSNDGFLAVRLSCKPTMHSILLLLVVLMHSRRAYLVLQQSYYAKMVGHCEILEENNDHAEDNCVHC